jgi:hypothetical protein
MMTHQQDILMISHDDTLEAQWVSGWDVEQSIIEGVQGIIIGGVKGVIILNSINRTGAKI